MRPEKEVEATPWKVWKGPEEGRSVGPGRAPGKGRSTSAEPGEMCPVLSEGEAGQRGAGTSEVVWHPLRLEPKGRGVREDADQQL